MRHENWTPSDTTYVELAGALNNDRGGTEQNLSAVLHWSTSVIKILYTGLLKIWHLTFMCSLCKHFCHKTDHISSLSTCEPKIVSCIFLYILIEKYSSEEECDKS